jgi:hypothetical protein
MRRLTGRWLSMNKQDLEALDEAEQQAKKFLSNPTGKKGGAAKGGKAK